MKDKLDQIRESAEADLSIFIKLVAPHLMLGAVHEELIQWWTRSEAKNNQIPKVALFIPVSGRSSTIYGIKSFDIGFLIFQIVDYNLYWHRGHYIHMVHDKLLFHG